MEQRQRRRRRRWAASRTAWAQPPWQSGVAVPQTAATEVCSNDPTGTPPTTTTSPESATNLPGGTLCRETPDVSALADPQTGVTIVYGGGWFQIGGTSSATPCGRRCWPRSTPRRACSGQPRRGRASRSRALPDRRQTRPPTPTPSTTSPSVTTTTSASALAQTGYPFYAAGTGYDLASGSGTPQVTNATNTGLSASSCAAIADGGDGAGPTVASVADGTVTRREDRAPVAHRSRSAARTSVRPQRARSSSAT